MAQSYTPGLKVTGRIRHRMRRTLPIAGNVLVKVGDRVAARDIVAQTHMPGDITPIHLANKLSVPPGDVPECMLVSEGTQITIGDVVARTKGIFGFFKAEFASPVAGLLESVSNVTGQLIVRGDDIPVQVLAHLAGDVVEVIPNEGVIIENDVTLIQGIFGIGGETYGTIRMACDSASQDLTTDRILPDMQGQIVIGGARMTGDAVRRAIEVGAAAVISGGMDDEDLRRILGYDLGVAITGSETIGTTLIITEGFGDIAMAERTHSLLASRVGDEAAVNGATQIRAGVMRPEILIPVTAPVTTSETEASRPAGMLETGAAVRIIRDPHFGVIGSVGSLPSDPQVLGSESRARVLGVIIADGTEVLVPRANVELIER